MGFRVVPIFLVIVTVCNGCIQLMNGWKQVSVEERARRAPIVFHGLAIDTTPDADPVTYSGHFWIINVYKGNDELTELFDQDRKNVGSSFNLKDRRINVTRFGDKSQCHVSVVPQKYYVVFAEKTGNTLVAKYDDLFGATAEWTPENENRVWAGVGWEPWTDWSACTVSCGEGTQERRRFCRQDASCLGYNKEKRQCNMFSCQGAVDPLSLEDRRFFHPSRNQWEHVPGRATAWRLKPNSYIWVPSSELFPASGPTHTGTFPREFTLLVTLRLHQQNRAQGTVFSLRSRRQQDAYLSLELDGSDAVKIVHAGPNGTQTVVIPASLGDGDWHQLAIGIHDDSSVRSYLDCAWVSTDILKRNSLDTPDDADIVIGYLFMGDLEQLVIVPNPAAVGQQCSATRLPLLDPSLLKTPRRTNRKVKGRKGVKYEMGLKAQSISHNEVHSEDETSLEYPRALESTSLAGDAPRVGPFLRSQPRTPVTLIKPARANYPVDEDDSNEGSGSNGNPLDDDQYEVEWSEWSDCSSSCGTGAQSRYSRCIDDGSRLELCMEAGGERTETRACSHGPCSPKKPASVLRHQDSEDNDQSWTNMYKTSHDILNPFTFNDKVDTTQESNSVLTSPPMQPLIDIDHPELTKKMVHKIRKKMHLKNGIVKKEMIFNVTVHNKTLWDLHQAQHDKLLESEGFSKKACPCLNGGSCHAKRRSCHCPTGYYGHRCERAACHPVCANGGHCVSPDVCSCAPLYGGPRCQQPLCPEGCQNGGTCTGPGECSCTEHFMGPLCQEHVCPVTCQNGGSCNGAKVCVCASGWAGTDCSTPVCDPACRYGGQCVSPHTCHCPTGTSGSHCQNFSCRSVCLNGGACVGPDQCECLHNSSGATCADAVCDPPCEHGATCSAGNRCICDAGTTGTRCEKKKCEYRPYQEPYTRGFRRLVNKRFETKCEPWGWKTCVQNQPEYQTVYKTFYRTVYKCADTRH